MNGLAPKFLNRGSGAVSSPITGSAPAEASAGPSGNGAITQFRGELSDVMTGRVSLLMLNTLIIALILFYLWTRSAQGGG